MRIEKILEVDLGAPIRQCRVSPLRLDRDGATDACGPGPTPKRATARRCASRFYRTNLRLMSGAGSPRILSGG